MKLKVINNQNISCVDTFPQGAPEKQWTQKAENCGALYGDAVFDRLQSIRNTQAKAIGEVAALLVQQIEKDGLIHVFGVGGHSFIGSEEFFYRAGGLANINPIFDLSLSLAGGGRKSTELERTENYGNKVVRLHCLQEGDPVIITSAYGINACTIDAAVEAKKLGCKVIAITSVEFASNTPLNFKARHSSAKNLHDIADIVIDNHVPHGEAILQLEGLAQPVGGTCTVLGAFCIQWLVTTTVQMCLDAGIDPPVWKSANMVGGDEANSDYMKRFGQRIKYL
jgi:uncharacterized phosphosugar-binding protein